MKSVDGLVSARMNSTWKRLHGSNGPLPVCDHVVAYQMAPSICALDPETGLRCVDCATEHEELVHERLCDVCGAAGATAHLFAVGFRGVPIEMASGAAVDMIGEITITRSVCYCPNATCAPTANRGLAAVEFDPPMGIEFIVPPPDAVA